MPYADRTVELYKTGLDWQAKREYFANFESVTTPGYEWDGHEEPLSN